MRALALVTFIVMPFFASVPSFGTTTPKCELQGYTTLTPAEVQILRNRGFQPIATSANRPRAYHVRKDARGYTLSLNAGWPARAAWGELTTVPALTALNVCSYWQLRLPEMSARAVMNAVAREVAWAFHDPAKFKTLKWGETFLMWETAARKKSLDTPEFQTLLATYNSLVEGIRSGATGPFIERLDHAREQLIKNRLQHYCAKFDDLTSVVAHTPCGNCLSETLMFTAALIDAGFPLPSNERLAVQLFNDHVQAVLLRNDGRIVNLMTGAQELIERQQTGYVLKPEVLFWALLRNMGWRESGAVGTAAGYASVSWRNQQLTLRGPVGLAANVSPFRLFAELRSTLGVPALNTYYDLGFGYSPIGQSTPNPERAEAPFQPSRPNERVASQGSLPPAQGADSPRPKGSSWFSELGTKLRDALFKDTEDDRKALEGYARFAEQMNPSERARLAPALNSKDAAAARAILRELVGDAQKTLGFESDSPAARLKSAPDLPPPLEEPPKTASGEHASYLLGSRKNEYASKSLNERWKMIGRGIEENLDALEAEPGANIVLRLLREPGFAFTAPPPVLDQAREWLQRYVGLQRRVTSLYFITQNTESELQNEGTHLRWVNPRYYVIRSNSFYEPKVLLGSKRLTQQILRAASSFAAAWDGRHRELLELLERKSEVERASIFNVFSKLCTDFADHLYGGRQLMSAAAATFYPTRADRSLRDDEASQAIWDDPRAMRSAEFHKLSHLFSRLLLQMLTDEEFEYRITERQEAEPVLVTKPRPQTPGEAEHPIMAREHGNQLGVFDSNHPALEDRRGADQGSARAHEQTHARADLPPDVDGLHTPSVIAAEVISASEYQKIVENAQARERLDELILHRKVKLLPRDVMNGLLEIQARSYVQSMPIRILLYPMVDEKMASFLSERLGEHARVLSSLVNGYYLEVSADGDPTACSGGRAVDCNLLVHQELERHAQAKVPKPFQADPFLKWAVTKYKQDLLKPKIPGRFNYAKILSTYVDKDDRIERFKVNFEQAQKHEEDPEFFEFRGYRHPQVWAWARDYRRSGLDASTRESDAVRIGNTYLRVSFEDGRFISLGKK